MHEQIDAETAGGSSAVRCGWSRSAARRRHRQWTVALVVVAGAAAPRAIPVNESARALVYSNTTMPCHVAKCFLRSSRTFQHYIIVHV